MVQDDTNTSCSADDPLDEARSIIDSNIARLEESIRALKSRRNELSPISRLPAEILCNIFSLTEEDNTVFRSPKSWTNFSQVSQHWRSLALSAPELWTNIPLGYPRWAQEMLTRSKMAKLTIQSGPILEASDPKTFKTVRSCLYEMSRVKEIDLQIPGWILERIFRNLPKSAPQLHTLCIKCHTLRYGRDAFSVPEDFLNDTERLQRVVLIDCKISWDSRLLTGLTSLTLENSLKANSSIIQFLHALQRMPALTDLDLKDSIPKDSIDASTYPVVDLPCLRVLRISSGVGAGALATVLRHITVPHSAILNLTCKENRSTQIDFSNLLSVLGSRFLSSLIIRSLSLQVLDGPDDTETRSLEFRLWIQDCFPFSSLISVQSQLQLFLTWPSSHRHNYVDALTCAFDAINLPFLTQLQISTLDCIDSQTWVKTFGKLPLLERVCVQSYALPSFAEALVYKTKAAEKSKTAYRNVSFPKLRYIHLEGIIFLGILPRYISVDMLLDYLMERCERNAELQVLRLDDCCDISSNDVKRLKEIVVDVIWDGVEQVALTHRDPEEDRGYDYDDLSSSSEELSRW